MSKRKRRHKPPKILWRNLQWSQKLSRYLIKQSHPLTVQMEDQVMNLKRHLKAIPTENYSCQIQSMSKNRQKNKMTMYPQSTKTSQLSTHWKQTCLNKQIIQEWTLMKDLSITSLSSHLKLNYFKGTSRQSHSLLIKNWNLIKNCVLLVQFQN